MTCRGFLAGRSRSLEHRHVSEQAGQVGETQGAVAFGTTTPLSPCGGPRVPASPSGRSLSSPSRWAAQDPGVGGMVCAFLPHNSGLSAQTAQPAFSRNPCQALACREPQRTKPAIGQGSGCLQTSRRGTCGHFSSFLGAGVKLSKTCPKTFVARTPHSDLEKLTAGWWHRRHTAKGVALLFSKMGNTCRGQRGTCCGGGAQGRGGQEGTWKLMFGTPKM